MNLENIKGIGIQTINKLKKININTVNDLINYYPYKYNYINIVDINNVNNEDNCALKATIVDSGKVQYIKRNFNYLKFKVITNNILLTVTIFNRSFYKQNLIIGKDVIIIGKLNKLKNSFIASDIKFNLCVNSIEPIYHLIDGLKNSTIIKIIDEALNNSNSTDLIPKEYISKYNFIDKDISLKLIHNPNSFNDINVAKERLKYEELFDFMFKINYLNIINKKSIGIKRNLENDYQSNFLKELDFNLTKDQLLAINDIYSDLKKEVRMNRLILGDVGSGKTIVATYAIYINFLSGYQSALMAPTEILAIQHFNSMSTLLKKFNINVALLTGSTKKKEKDEILENLKNGTINLIIGTHSLISENVTFNNLGLVITDEQHRFGVLQRNNLSDKGEYPDVLYLSATPIPRTYALTIYGDLDISLIKTKPQGRKEIITKVFNENNLKDVLYKMLEELKLGHQIYVVSPLIENNEESNLKSVIELKEKLNIAFQNKVNIEILHGKIKGKEKDIIMDNFKNGNIKILISTTVIEVGINVPNSTMIVIFNSERFGLATLHQLRGRVGRSDLQSYCYLISNKEIERLKVLEESNDGFYISEKDFEMRGQGDLFGEKQSGSIPFKIANLKDDYELLLKAKKDSLEFITSKNYLNYPYYKDVINNISFIN